MAGLRHGLSPHAPYTTSPALLREAWHQAWRNHEFLCIHAAETPEETEMLLHGRGPLHDFLADMRVLPKNWKAPGLRPIPYLEQCGVLGAHTLLVHVNDATDEDLRILHHTQTHVVVCPGTHAYFGRGEFPLARLLSHGVRVLLGTDSLASNADLDMAREVRLATEFCPEIHPQMIEDLALIGHAGDYGV